MGVTLFAIMKHNLDARQILALPERMKSWEKVTEHVVGYHLSEYGKAEQMKPPHWRFDDKNPLSAQDIEREWEANEKDEAVARYCDLEAGYASFKFNRKTLIVSPFPYHKYGNLFDFDTRKYMLELMRLIGQNFGTDKILYCPDSSCSTAVLEEKARQGCSLEELEAYGRATFGRIPERLSEAVYNYFFIDDFTLDLHDFNKDRFLFDRAAEEYLLEMKFGQRFVIFRI